MIRSVKTLTPGRWVKLSLQRNLPLTLEKNGGCFNLHRSFSSLPGTTGFQPPSQMNEEIVLGIQDATKLYIRNGIGNQRLLEVSKDTDSTLVTRWQKMMEAFLGTQVHILAGLGYSPDEKGLAFYNQQLAHFVQSCSPEVQEQFRIKGRDTWRLVLSTAFDMDVDSFQELSIVEARNIMHTVSQKMQDQEVLDSIASRCAEIEPDDNPQIEMARKHNIVQEVLVNEVYLSGSPSLVEECGFGEGEEGYVRMQCIMSEHQADPLIAQYIGTSMMKVLTSAGLDLTAQAG